MEILDLSNNTEFAGQIPETLELTEPLLSVLRLGGMNISGTIPKSFDSFEWKSLHLFNNSITGTIPALLPGNLYALEELLLHGNALTGSLPVSPFANALKLTMLTLYSNFLTGDVGDLCQLFDVGSLELMQVDKTRMSCECCNVANEPADGLNADESDLFGTFVNLVADDVTTTSMDPYVKGDCLLSDGVQPHVLNQCECTGRISFVAEDIEVSEFILVVTK